MSTAHYAARPQAPQYPGSTARLSSRSSYPTFLSVQDSVLLQLSWAWRGLYDAFRWGTVFITIASDAEIRANVYKSLLLNSLSLVSIYVFDLLLLPLVKDQQKWFHRNIGWFYQVLWLFPVVGVSLYLNGTWCTIIAKRTYLLQHGGRPVASQPASYTGMLKAMATSAYRVVMVCTSVLVSLALHSVPVVGPVAGFIFLCWVDAYYCFEFVWIARGLSLSRRMRHLEERWAYYFAFGLPSAALCTWGTGLANAALFALFFPVFIIMAMHARPVPLDPYNPMPPMPSSKPEENEVIRHPSPFIPIRLPIFAIVIWINDAIVKVISVIGGRPIVRHKAASRGRAFSDPSENVEDGDAGHVELRAFNNTATSVSSKALPLRSTNGRVNIGGRRKRD
ncbi:etoposide-induced protein 2.4-domain-containing protein [Crassisporium funariophilum]|nr:etoposide-induced protein 2.4-domain-containing protein [Crassisporium funariophilum]